MSPAWAILHIGIVSEELDGNGYRKKQELESGACRVLSAATHLIPKRKLSKAIPFKVKKNMYNKLFLCSLLRDDTDKGTVLWKYRNGSRENLTVRSAIIMTSEKYFTLHLS